MTDVEKSSGKIAIDLLNRKELGKISDEEFNKELAYWMFACAGDAKYVPYPVPPQQMQDYWSMPAHQRAGVSKDFWSRDDIRAYIKAREETKNRNDETFSLLKQVVDLMPEGPDREKSVNRMTEFLDSQNADYFKGGIE